MTMVENALTAALARRNSGRPPVWMMRQAGRYHAHYQSLKRYVDFLTLCRDPQFAAETALGPVHDFNFDAAILFSDLLFPLEAMGMGLTYAPGPRLSFHLRTASDLARLTGGEDKASGLRFQSEAMKLTRARLRPDKGLLGFVGGPFTLYVYAAAGSHENAREALPGLQDGRYDGFNERLLDLLARNMADQAAAGADTIAVLDTAAGEVGAEVFSSRIVPVLDELLARFRKLDPRTPVTYYSRGTGPTQWRSLESLPIACLGIDWRHDLARVLDEFTDRWCIQGNVDPDWLLLPTAEMEERIRGVFAGVLALPVARRAAWVCGLGHGILQKTPEANVRRFVEVQRELFG
jgi:uroporphyrinogen decarboxylase